MKKRTNKFSMRFWMAILLAPFLVSIIGILAAGCGGGGGGGSEEEINLEGKIAISDDYALNRASIGTTFGVVESLNRYYEVDATAGYPFSNEVSDSDNYKFTHTINLHNVLPSIFQR